MKTNQDNTEKRQDLRKEETKQSFLDEVTQSVVISHSTFGIKMSGEEVMFQSTNNPIIDNQDQDAPDSSHIFVWGDNRSGQLSLDVQTKLIPDPIAIRLDSIGKIYAVACGQAHALLVSATGVVFTMGDNSFGQLGVPKSHVKSSRKPIQVRNFASKENFLVADVKCADGASFLLLKAVSERQSDELYSWGSTQDGVLGQGNQDQVAVENPKIVEFPSNNEKTPVKIDHFSVGQAHVAVVTKKHEMYCWGANSKGQLGLGDIKNRWKPTRNVINQAALVSCGNGFTFLISGLNEIMISGKLPFMVQNEQKDEQDFIATFQSIAQFDQRVKILQVEASRFASILVDPVEDDQPKELFLWGQSPLGIFNELTPLNQLFSNCQESTEEQGQTFNVKAVRNGLNFCVFVDENTGMTYQVGADNMVDPYADDALVSLSELRDAQFCDLAKFDCGQNFVIGESKVSGTFMACSPMKKVSNLRQSPMKMSSMIKDSILGVSEREDQSNFGSPDGSKQSFPQRALYNGTSSPSTPTISERMRPFSGQSYKTCEQKDMMASVKLYEASKPETQKMPPSQHDRSRSCSQTKENQARQTVTAKIEVISKEAEFNKTTQIKTLSHDLNPQNIEILSQTDVPSDSATFNMLHQNQQKPDEQKTQKKPTNEIFQSQIKKEKNFMFSPDVSPIGGVVDKLFNSSIIDQNWMDGISSYPIMSSEKDIEKKQSKLQEKPTTNQGSCQKSLKSNQYSSQMPLQMQQSSHVVYQSQQPHAVMTRNQEAQNIGLARYLPVQRSMSSARGSMVGSMGYMEMGAQNQMMNQSHMNALDLNLSIHQHLADQQSFYEQMMKEKLETAQLRGQLVETQRQLDKSRRDYAKLLSQVDEDHEETRALKDKNSQQETDLFDMAIKVRDQEGVISRITQEKTKLETEIGRASNAYTMLQAKLASEQQKVKDLQAKNQLQCSSKICKNALIDFEAQLQKKTKQIYDLTVQLGCLELENKEVKMQLIDKVSDFEQKLDSSRLIAEQEIDDGLTQIQELTEALSEAHAKIASLTQAANKEIPMISQSIQTDTQVRENKCFQTDEKQKEDELPRFSHSVQKLETVSLAEEEKYLILPTIPSAVFEEVSKVRAATVEHSLVISINLNQQEQQDSSLCHDDSLGEASLKEFRFIEQSTRVQQKSLDMPRSSAPPMTQRNSSLNKYFIASNNPEEKKPKHNFIGRESTQLRKSDQRHSSTLLIEQPESRVERNTPLQMPPESKKKQKDDLNNRITFFQKNLNIKSNTQEQQSPLISFREQTQFVEADAYAEQLDKTQRQMNTNLEGDADESGLSFKPTKTNPNDRYSLKRHQETILENQNSQRNSQVDQKTEQNFDRIQTEKEHPLTSRRAKSNCDAGALQMASQKTRRLRNQRKAEAGSRVDDKSCEDVSQRSFGGKSNSTIAMMTEKMSTQQVTKLGETIEDLFVQKFSEKNTSFCDNKSKRSLLQQPTHLTKSPQLRATLSKLDKNQTSQQHFNKGQLTTHNQIHVEQDQLGIGRQSQSFMQPNQTPIARNSEAVFFDSKRSSAHDLQKHRTTLAGINNSRDAQTSRPSIKEFRSSYDQSQANLKSTTPRIKSQSTLKGNSISMLGRQSKQSTTTDNPSATARRVAYDHSRKLATQSMKQMTQTGQNNYSEINRQARNALASITHPVMPSYRKNESAQFYSVEEPFANPPQKQKKTEMAEILGMEESDLHPAMSDRAKKIVGSINTNKYFEFAQQSQRGAKQNFRNYQTHQNLSIQTSHPVNYATHDSTRSKDISRQQTVRQSTSSKSSDVKSVKHQRQQNVDNSRKGSPDNESCHLSLMKDKLQLIQSNKQLLEQKIVEYESKLKEISQEKSTQEIWVNAQRKKCKEDQNSQEYSLGNPSHKYEEKQIVQGYTERNTTRRRAFEQLNTNLNTSSTLTQQASGKAYRECYIGPPIQPMKRMQADPALMSRTHHASQAIFRQ